MIEIDTDGSTVLRVPGALSLAEASAARTVLLDALATSKTPLRVGLDRPVDGIAGLQLALAAAASLDAAGRFAGFTADAPAVLSEALR